MVKTIHHVSTPNSGALDSFCVESWKKIYPDWKISNWTIGGFDSHFGFEVLRIIYENGGLFIGNNVQAIKAIPDSYFEKSFISFDNSLESSTPNPRICAYCEKGDESIKRILGSKRFPEINSNGESDVEVDGVNYLNRMEFGMYDKEAGELYNDGYLLYVDSRDDKLDNYEVSCHRFEGDTTMLFNVVEHFVDIKYDEVNRFLLLYFDKIDEKAVDAANRAMLWLNYNCNEKLGKNRKWGIIATDGGGRDLISEYIGRRFNNMVNYNETSG